MEKRQRESSGTWFQWPFWTGPDLTALLGLTGGRSDFGPAEIEFAGGCVLSWIPPQPARPKRPNIKVTWTDLSFIADPSSKRPEWPGQNTGTRSERRPLASDQSGRQSLARTHWCVGTGIVADPFLGSILRLLAAKKSCVHLCGSGGRPDPVTATRAKLAHAGL